MPVNFGKTEVGTEPVPDIIAIKYKGPAAGLVQFLFHGMGNS